MIRNRNALYYPSIEFKNPKWLWTAALLWDRIYRIIPDNYTPQDSRNIQELMEDGTIGAGINPQLYIKETADDFIEKFNGEWWRAPSFGDFQLKRGEEYVRLHKDKADVRVRNMFSVGSNRGEWLEVPRNVAGLYMTYLSNHIAEGNQLEVITDDSAAWCGSNYLYYDGTIDDWELEGSVPEKIGSISFQDFLPGNVLSIQPKDLLKFREKRKDERHRFLDAMDSLALDISKCSDPKILSDLIADRNKEILEAKEEFKKSMDMIHIKGWMGVKSALIPMISPILSSLYHLPDSVQLKLNAAGIVFGGIAGFIDMKQKKEAYKKGFSYNYLLEVKNELERSRVCFGNYNEYSDFLAYEMNNFIND